MLLLRADPVVSESTRRGLHLLRSKAGLRPTSAIRGVGCTPRCYGRRDRGSLLGQLGQALSATAQVDSAWAAFIERKRAEELERIVADEGLDAAATRAFVEVAFRDGALQPTGTAIAKILPAVSRFGPQGAHGAKKLSVLSRLSDYFDRFFGLS